MARIFFLFCVLLVFCAGSGSGMEFGGVRSWGMGGAFTAFGGDNNAVYHNPAGLAGAKAPELSVNAGHFRIEPWSGSIAGMIYSFPCERCGADMAAMHWNNYYDGDKYIRQAGMTLAWKRDTAAESLSWGSTLKWREDATTLVQAGLVDLGVQKEWKERRFTAGFLVRNLLSPDQHAANLSPSAGLLYRSSYGIFACDVNWYTDGPYLSAGIERNLYRGLMILRAGYLGAFEPMWTIGASSRLQPVGFDVSYSWPAKQSQSTGYFQVALRYRFSGESFSQDYMSMEDYRAGERRKREAAARAEEEAEARRRAAAAAARARENIKVTWPQSHRVSPGETLRSIAQRYYGNPNKWQIIYNANTNKIERGQPKTGETLVLPAPN